MENSLNQNLEELKIPEFTPLTTVLGCQTCHLARTCIYYNHSCSKYDCEIVRKKYSKILLVFELIVFLFSTSLTFIFFNGFWLSTLKIFITFLSLLLIDYLSNNLLKTHFSKLEKQRRQNYQNKVSQIKAENETIRKAKLGITKEVENFLINASTLLGGLSNVLNFLKESESLTSKEGIRVITKLTEVIDELGKLNSKISKDNFEISYINTLYHVHLPKLLEYSQKFLELLNTNSLTQEQIVEFAKLLEVFRTKIANHTTYMEEQTRDDFLIKLQALNDTVLPEYNGSEDTQDEG